MRRVLATGKPLVTATLPGLQDALSEYAYLAGEREEFIRVLCCLPGSETPEKVRARLELTRENPRKSRFDATLWGWGGCSVIKIKRGDGTPRSTPVSSAADAAGRHVC